MPGILKKKLNRNPFDEKILHRYLFERYYFGDNKIRNSLLPPEHHKKEINLIVPEENFDINAWYLTTITTPYYMVPTGELSTFFEENEDLPINKRRWPHFIDFRIEDSYEPSTRINFGPKGEFSKIFMQSNNIGSGSPVPISQGQWYKLIDKLNYIRKKNNL